MRVVVYIITAIFIAILFYLVGSLVTWDLNIFNWPVWRDHTNGRVFIFTFLMLVGILSETILDSIK